MELALLLKVGRQIGVLNTVSVVVFTGILGVYLARSQGLMIMKKISLEINSYRMPADSLMEGALILSGGILLLTPGFVTDTIGFIMLIPFSRRLIRKWIKKKLKAKFEGENYYIDVNGQSV